MASDIQAETQEERMFRLRSVYSTALNDVLDRVLAEVLLPADKAALATDFSQFAKFLACTKMAEVQFRPFDKDLLLKAFWQMHAAERNEVPDMLRVAAAEAAVPL